MAEELAKVERRCSERAKVLEDLNRRHPVRSSQLDEECGEASDTCPLPHCRRFDDRLGEARWKTGVEGGLP